MTKKKPPQKPEPRQISMHNNLSIRRIPKKSKENPKILKKDYRWVLKEIFPIIGIIFWFYLTIFIFI